MVSSKLYDKCILPAILLQNSTIMTSVQKKTLWRDELVGLGKCAGNKCSIYLYLFKFERRISSVSYFAGQV